MKNFFFYLKNFVFIFLLLIIFIANAQATPVIEWVSESGDYVVGDTIAGWDIIDWKNAGSTNNEWTVTGGGAYSGNGDLMLWLLNTPNTATVTLSEKSNAISFMMHGNHNDGYANFYVDGTFVETKNMFYLDYQSLIVSNLDFDYHTIAVEMAGYKDPASLDDHIHICGGAALSAPVPEPSTWLLLCFGLIGMVGFKKKFS